MRLNLFRSEKDASGWVGRILRALGPTWSATPIRRLVQILCLLAFLILFFYVCWPYGSRQYAEAFRRREMVAAELFLLLDPLAVISAALAARMLIWPLVATGGVVFVCLLLPRAFCGYVCPLGTLLDGFDWLVGKRVRFLRLTREGWWVQGRYYLLVMVLVAALFGVLLSGFVAAIPVLTRALLLLAAPVQTGLLKGWYLVPPGNFGHALSIGLVITMFGLGLLAPRFWCRYVCPTGALFSVAGVLRWTERRVTGACVKCGRCQEVCSFAAIRGDFSTRFANCTSCQSCGGVCPVGAIEFTPRWSRRDVQGTNSTTPRVVLSRRAMLAGLSGAATAGVGASWMVREVSLVAGAPAIRPPGSVPEDQFLRLCVRCGECIKVCPNNVLQPAGFEHGCNGLWTPKVVADWSGCEPSCNNCGHVCPTGAIRALTLAEKRAARMGLAQVNPETCLPYAGHEACQLCVDECRMAGYDALEFLRVGGRMDDRGEPVEGSGWLAPVVREEKCVGCGLCQMRCHAVNVKTRKVLHRSAIQVVAGEGREDRLPGGSYLALQKERVRRRQQEGRPEGRTEDDYLPDFLK